MDQELIGELYRTMRRIRRFEEEVERLCAEGELSVPLPLYKGQEAVAVGAASVIEANDYVITGLRCHGHFLARGGSLHEAFAALFDKRSECGSGRGGGLQIFKPALRFMGGWGLEAAHVPLAAGLALAGNMLKNPAVVICFLSPAGAQSGLFHEGSVLTSLWKLPLVIVIEHVHDAAEDEVERRDLSTFAFSYGFARDSIDGRDLFAVRAAVHSAATQARETRVPTIVEARCVDPAAPRPAIVEHAGRTAADPLACLAAKLDSLNMSAVRGTLDDEVERELAEALAAARADERPLAPAL